MFKFFPKRNLFWKQKNVIEIFNKNCIKFITPLNYIQLNFDPLIRFYCNKNYSRKYDINKK